MPTPFSRLPAGESVGKSGEVVVLDQGEFGGQVVSGCWLAASVQLGASWCLALAVGRLSWPVIVGKQGSCYPLSSPES